MSTTAAPPNVARVVKKTAIIAKKKVKSTDIPTEQPVPTIVVDDATETEADGEVVIDQSQLKTILQRLDEQIEELKEFKALTRGLCNGMIDLLTESRKEIKTLQKKQKKPRVAKEPKKQSVFEVAVPISNELAAFFEKPSGTIMSRNDVTHEIHKYCVKNELMKTENRQIINPDVKLGSLLKNFPENGELTWLNLQTFIKHHYN